MNKNILLVIGAVVIIGLGLFMFLGNGEDEDSSANSSESSQITETSDATATDTEATTEIEAAATVTYTDDGFSPETTKIKAGEAVVFINNSSKSMWVASADHPAHDVLPAFDSKAGVGPGESYAFTFDEAGEWGFHDHLNANAEGTIIVTAN